ncbi:MAG: glycerol-3-phosphate dehydrogenase/oxidase [Gemmatimonadaceae bacterium]
MRRNPRALSEQSFDLVVIGGGIVGACVARDAVTRGFSVALIEKGDFSSGTSAASSKMIHGGLRYLAQLQLSVVRESLRERRIWQRIAPHLVHPIPFVLPVTGIRQRLEGRVGLALFDLLSWDRGKLDDPDQRLSGHEWWSASEALERIPMLRGSGISGAGCYADCQALSPERLCLECLTDAASEGAVIANAIECTGVMRQGKRVAGVAATDSLTGEAMSIRARCVVNATGPWADELLALVEGATHAPRITRSKGAHIVVRQLASRYALTLRYRGRHAFVIPWRDHTLIGTTDTPYHGSPDDVQPNEEDIQALLDIVNAGMPAAALTFADVRYAYAGLRPLVADDGRPSYYVSRRAEIVDHGQNGGLVGLVSALGGKWTTARHVAEQCVAVVAGILGAADRPCVTRDRPLPGGDVGLLRAFRARAHSTGAGVTSETLDHLIDLYGARYLDVIAAARDDQSLLSPIASTVPDIGAQVLYAVREEQALHLLDVLLRRTGLGTLGAPSADVVDRVSAIMAAALQWSESELARERGAVATHYRNAVAAVTADNRLAR